MALKASRIDQPSRPRIHDVAQRAGVSNSTVLRTMKGVPSVRKNTADRVWESLEELGFIRHSGRGAIAKNRLLGLVIAPLSEPHSAELIARFHESAALLGYDVLTCSIGVNGQQAAAQVQTLLDRKVEGIAALILNPDSPLAEALSLVEIPVIYCDSNRAVRNGAALSIDYARGVREAVQHLALLGHREIAFIGAASNHLATKRKSEAFLLALKEIGCLPNSDWLIEADSSFTSGIAGMEQLLTFSPLPTAVLCSCDAVALGALWALRHAGISVPDGISLICLDECQFAEWMAPTVTTVQISIPDFATTALATLQNLIDNPTSNTGYSVFKVPTSLVMRGSTSYPPGRALPTSNQAGPVFEQPSAL
jgi:DNA-binding LacI/PurR family transcriptional regulator